MQRRRATSDALRDALLALLAAASLDACGDCTGTCVDAASDTTLRDSGLDAPFCTYQFDTPYSNAILQCPPSRASCQICPQSVDVNGCPIVYQISFGTPPCDCLAPYHDPHAWGRCEAGVTPFDAAADTTPTRFDGSAD